jgi:hypothetical protein
MALNKGLENVDVSRGGVLLVGGKVVDLIFVASLGATTACAACAQMTYSLHKTYIRPGIYKKMKWRV